MAGALSRPVWRPAALPVNQTPPITAWAVVSLISTILGWLGAVALTPRWRGLATLIAGAIPW